MRPGMPPVAGAELARTRICDGGRCKARSRTQWRRSGPNLPVRQREPVTSPPLAHPASRLDKCDGGHQHGSMSFNLQGRQAKSFTGGPKAYLNRISGFVVVKENDHKTKLWRSIIKLWRMAFAWTSGLALTTETRWPGRRHGPPR
jgi:hypothetical protein